MNTDQIKTNQDVLVHLRNISDEIVAMTHATTPDRSICGLLNVLIRVIENQQDQIDSLQKQVINLGDHHVP